MTLKQFITNWMAAHKNNVTTHGHDGYDTSLDEFVANFDENYEIVQSKHAEDCTIFCVYQKDNYQVKCPSMHFCTCPRKINIP